MICLDELLNIRNYCEPNKEGLYLDNFVDVPLSLLAQLANDSEQTGKKYGKNLIAGAVQELQADISLSVSDGYSIKDVVYQYNSNCQFTNTYASGFGISLTNFYKSNFAELVVPNIAYKPNFNGDFTLVITDGTVTKTYVATAQQGVVNNLSVDFKTKEKNVKIYAQDASLEFSVLNCTSTSCGSCAAKRGTYITVTGYNGSTNISTAAGFIPNVYIQCNMENIICAIVNKYKQLFAKALAYKVAELVYTRLLISPRMNDSTLNIDQDNVKLYLNTITAKYRELIHGSKAAYSQAPAKGIIDIMRASYKTLNDPCISCASSVFSSTALF